MDLYYNTTANHDKFVINCKLAECVATGLYSDMLMLIPLLSINHAMQLHCFVVKQHCHILHVLPVAPTSLSYAYAEQDKVNQMLPVGGLGKAYSAKEQADLLFQLTGLPPKYFPVPVALMDGIIGLLDLLSKVFPGLEVRAQTMQLLRC